MKIHYFHFPDEETKAQRNEATRLSVQLAHGGAETQIQSCTSSLQALPLTMTSHVPSLCSDNSATPMVTDLLLACHKVTILYLTCQKQNVFLPPLQVRIPVGL